MRARTSVRPSQRSSSSTSGSGNYNGLQLIHFSRQNSPDTQWLVVSGFDDPVLRAEATKLGALFLTKPLDLQRLRQHLPAQTV